mmetsp:Transcript_16472/g.23509  ORF Transcript_16472/g.23509 Transcript_16472/m.23509 type:complete len:99 (+) Transcript_16472:187-483(+)
MSTDSNLCWSEWSMERNYKAAMSKGETAPANQANCLIMLGFVLYSSRYARREVNKDSDNQWKIFLPAPQEMYFRITSFDFNVDGFQSVLVRMVHGKEL